MRRNEGRITIVLLVAMTLLAAGCSKPVETPPTGSVGDKYPMTVVDGTGRSVTLEAKPERIISLASSNTEILFAMGQDEKLVGVTSYCNYPPEAQEKAIVGGFSDPNLELMVALKADLVLGTSLNAGHVSEIEAVGPKVILLDSRSIDDVMADIELLGQIMDEEEAAEGLVATMRQKIHTVEAALGDLPDEDRLGVFYLMWDDPIMTVGPDTLISDILVRAGGVNIAADAEQDYPTYSLEVLVTKDPSAIVYTVLSEGGGFTAEGLRNKPGWGAITAVKDGRFVAVDDDTMSRPGPRVVDALYDTARQFYPDRFPGGGE